MKQILLLLFLAPFTLFSQQIVGTVMDLETGEPIPFAQLKLTEGTHTFTNENGEFSFQIDSFPATCIISATDYYPDTLQITSVRIEAIRLKALIPVQDIGPVVVAASRRKQSVE